MAELLAYIGLACFVYAGLSFLADAIEANDNDRTKGRWL